MVRWRLIAIIVICVLAAAGLFLSLSAPAVVPGGDEVPQEVVTPPVDSDDAQIDPYSFQVFMFAGGISPATITVPKDQKVTLVLKSSDGRNHRFMMPAFRVDEVVRPNLPVSVVIAPGTAGTFGYSDFEAYDGKAPGRGTLIVE